MKPQTALRVLRDNYLAAGPRQAYWNARSLGSELARLLEGRNRAFLEHATRDILGYWSGSRHPVHGETEHRARAAAEWLLRAQRATPDDGASLGWFPCSRDDTAWKPSYPETTGYIITSLLAYAKRFGSGEARDAALRMARWEAGIQMSSGAVQGGPLCAPERQTAAAFNTGMVLDGWCSALAEANDTAVASAARRAADWLVADLDDAGYFRTNGAFVKAGEVKTYTVLCAWAMHRFGDLVGEARYAGAALRAGEAALRQQRPNGWFACNCLVRSDAPLTHTIGYTLQGLLELGVLAGRDDFVSAVRKAADAIIPRIYSSGYLPGMFYADWEPARFSSCLTGSAQLAIVCYRLSELVLDDRYRVAANRLVDFLKAVQDVETPIVEAHGALPGSFPLFGEYMRGGYPNWATKYLLDALLLQDRAGAVSR